MSTTKMPAQTMLIGGLVDQVGVNAKTIRYYEDIGLLPEPGRTPAGYRTYTDGDADRLQFIRRAQRLDLHLDEIREILALREGGDQPCDYVVSVARDRVQELDERIAEMQRARQELTGLLDRADARGATGKYCSLVEHTTTTGNCSNEGCA